MRVLSTILSVLFISIANMAQSESYYYFHKYLSYGYKPLSSYRSNYNIDLPEKVLGIGYGTTFTEAEDNAIVSCLKALGCEVTILSENYVVEENNTINERHIHLERVQSQVKRFSGYNIVESKIYKNQYTIKRKKRYGGDTVIVENGYEVKCCFEPLKYAENKLLNEKDRKYIDSLLCFATLTPNGNKQYPYWTEQTKDQEIYGENTPKYKNCSANFRLGNLYLAYKKLDDELLEYLLPWITDIKNEIYAIAMEKQNSYQVALMEKNERDCTLGFGSLDHHNPNVNIDVEYSVDGGGWKQVERRGKYNLVYLRFYYDREYGMTRDEYLKYNIKRLKDRVRFRLPYFYIKEDGTKGVITDVSDEWYVIVAPITKLF